MSKGASELLVQLPHLGVIHPGQMLVAVAFDPPEERNEAVGERKFNSGAQDGAGRIYIALPGKSATKNSEPGHTLRRVWMVYGRL